LDGGREKRFLQPHGAAVALARCASAHAPGGLGPIAGIAQRRVDIVVEIAQIAAFVPRFALAAETGQILIPIIAGSQSVPRAFVFQENDPIPIGIESERESENEGEGESKSDKIPIFAEGSQTMTARVPPPHVPFALRIFRKARPCP
ncbi:MAG: hypothetical protein LBF91_04975, partial [Azoarcus sp.]|nr:hypothetical protein [Azoarcus sp.]